MDSKVAQNLSETSLKFGQKWFNSKVSWFWRKTLRKEHGEKRKQKWNFLVLQVQAKHEEQSQGKTVYREYNREFLLPAGTDAEQIRSSLSKDGILTVEAPLPQPALTQEKKN